MHAGPQAVESRHIVAPLLSCGGTAHVLMADTHDRFLERIGVLHSPSDLDLLVFFARHPRSLLASEQLSLLLGYGMGELADSLDRLVDAGLLTRAQSARHAARFFVLAPAASDGAGGWFPEFVKRASTREGRLAMLASLRRHTAAAGAGSPGRRLRAVAPVARPTLVRRKPAVHGHETG